MFINWICKNTEFTISDSSYTEEKTKESDIKEKEEIKNRTKRTSCIYCPISFQIDNVTTLRKISTAGL